MNTSLLVAYCCLKVFMPVVQIFDLTLSYVVIEFIEVSRELYVLESISY